MTSRRPQLVGALLSLIVFGAVVQQIMSTGRLVELDGKLAEHYATRHIGRVTSVERLIGNGASQRLGRFLSLFGDARLLLGAVIVVAFVLYQLNRRRDATFLAVALVGGIFVDLVARVWIGHVRPDLQFPEVISRFGLPSGHALDATAFYGALLVISWPRLSSELRLLATIGTSVLVAGIAYARVVVLAHNLSDVIAGVALGLAWLLLLSVAFNLPERDRLPSTA